MPHASGTENEPVALAALCDVCNVRRAAWVATSHGCDLVLCALCRAGEPCDRCGVEHARCACPEGPDVLAWVPLPAAS